MSIQSFPYPPKKGGIYQDFNQDDYMQASSLTDCTGLIPSDPDSEEQVENYNELYRFLPPEND